MLREGYHVLEVVFWAVNKDHPEKGIIRTGRTADTQPGLSHQPHVILNQARVNGLLLDRMRDFMPGTDISYGYEIKSVMVDEGASIKDSKIYPVTVTTESGGKEMIFKAKYALACDGAHSAVRRTLGYKMIGDSQNEVWGVMDIYPQTNFPDIRKKATLRSTAGNLLIIPREGGSLVRFYIELPHGTSAKDVTRNDLHQAAKNIFYPYSISFAETFWWSAYSVGQRLADHFSKSNRIFLTGDACHTHSPKAGQGMNVSLQDGHNIGWKLASVVNGHCSPEILLSYIIEREKVARDLIEFDKHFTSLFSSKAGHSPEHFRKQFIKAGRYTAGLTATYDDSTIINAKDSDQSLAKNLVVGMRFPAAQVVRSCDAKAMQLVKAIPADGRWRIIIFAGTIGNPASLDWLQKLASYFESSDSPVQKYTPANTDIDSFIEPIIVLSGKHTALEQEQLPDYFWPMTGKWRMRDLHKVYVDDESYNSGHGHAYEKYGIDPAKGAVVIVRPDQYISMVVGVDQHKKIGNFFAGFMLPQKETSQRVNGSS